jgi:NAD(P)-dependent dehydrogenase (short-subunit alcohol dehydrogenase family)
VRAKFGAAGIGAAVNTVGVFDERRPLIETDEAAYRRMLDLNLNGAFLFSKAVEPMLAPNSSILHVSSVNGFRAGNELGAYKIAKAGLHMLVRCLAADFAKDPRRIRANCVSPGWVDTPGERKVMTALGKPNILDDPASANIIPLGRRTESREIADAIAFLVSQRASAITGQILSVDCGIMIQ